MAVIPCTPQRANAFRSAWMPAPPPESEPAMESTRGGILASKAIAAEDRSRASGHGCPPLVGPKTGSHDVAVRLEPAKSSPGRRRADAGAPGDAVHSVP